MINSKKERCRCGHYKRNIYKDNNFTGFKICVRCNRTSKCPICSVNLINKKNEECPNCGATWRISPPISSDNLAKQLENKIDDQKINFEGTYTNPHFRPKYTYLFFDVETTGLPMDWKAPVSDLTNWPRIVEIAWILSDENGNEIENVSAILKNDNFSIPFEASKIHHITDEISNSKGHDRVAIFKKLAETISKAKALVAHNIDFDYKVLHAEFLRYKIKSGIYNIDKICTKELTTDYCKLPGNYGYKWPKMEELYYKVFGKEILNVHSASIDVKACKDCFFELANQGVFRLFGNKILVDSISNIDDTSLIYVDPYRKARNYDGYYQYYTHVRHLGLNEQKFIKADDEYTLNDRIKRQKERFIFKWENAKIKVLANQRVQIKKLEAEYKTREAEQKIKDIELLLENSLNTDPFLDWDKLKNNKPFQEPSPENYLENLISQVFKPQDPVLEKLHNEPIETDEIFQPKFRFIDNLFKSLKEKKIKKYRSLFQIAHENWLSEKIRIETKNKENLEKYLNEISKYNKLIETIKIQNLKDIEEWNKRKVNYEKNQAEHNAEIDKFMGEYFNKVKGAIVKYCNLVLNNSDYPDYFPKIFSINYVDAWELLIVDYCLPEKANLPLIKSIKYLKNEDVFKETKISEAKLNSLFSSVVFQICVRTKNELYKSDVCNAIKFIQFNGYLNEKDKQFIISVLSDKETFLNLQLKGVDCKDVVKKFGGTFNNKLTTIEPTLTTKLI
ncbi:MAG TPA: 3'-5' exonuclease [Bacteroidales bacterium]|nr:3'-5' exonuclease [Bacteroidales bacterium]